MKWTLVNPAGTNDPETGDIYSGLDRFGRVKDNRWLDGEGTDLDRIQYGYDRAGNRLWRRNVVAAALDKEFDEIYAYDGVHRLQDMARGTLNAERTALTSETFAQCWTLDSTGNWHGFREDSDGNGTWDLIQQRMANRVNEITDVSETAGPSWVTPAYSRAGNMTTMPKVADPTESQTCQYDAWNRLVKVSEGANTVAEYQYDGAKRGIVQKSYTAGVLNETRHLYYTEPSSWQVIEERVGTSPDSADAERQFVCGLRYIDDLVLRDRDTDDDGSLDERLYACQDANWNVTAVVDNAADIQERDAYSAYGVPVFLTAAFGTRAASTFQWDILYCGYNSCSQTELYCVRRRIFQESLGLWTTRDSIGLHFGRNLYEYGWSRPLNLRDPTGAIPMGCPCKPEPPTCRAQIEPPLIMIGINLIIANPNVLVCRGGIKIRNTLTQEEDCYTCDPQSHCGIECISGIPARSLKTCTLHVVWRNNDGEREEREGNAPPLPFGAWWPVHATCKCV